MARVLPASARLTLALLLSVAISSRIKVSNERTMITEDLDLEESGPPAVPPHVCDFFHGDKLELVQKRSWAPRATVEKPLWSMFFEIGKDVKDFRGFYKGQCLSHCTVVQYLTKEQSAKRLQKDPTKVPKGSHTSCKKAFWQDYSTDPQKRALVKRVETVAKTPVAKLCCIMNDVEEAEDQAPQEKAVEETAAEEQQQATAEEAEAEQAAAKKAEDEKAAKKAAKDQKAAEKAAADAEGAVPEKENVVKDEEVAPGTTYSLKELQAGCPPGVPWRDGCAEKEKFLNDADFELAFKMSRADFAKLPKWKQNAAKKAAKLF